MEDNRLHPPTIVFPPPACPNNTVFFLPAIFISIGNNYAVIGLKIARMNQLISSVARVPSHPRVVEFESILI